MASQPNVNRNILASGNGGAGGNGGTAGNTLISSKGGNGGTGGDTRRGVYSTAAPPPSSTTPLPPTKPSSPCPKAGRHPGDAGGSAPAHTRHPRHSGTGNGGGYYNNAGAASNLGNTILDTNNAGFVATSRAITQRQPRRVGRR